MWGGVHGPAMAATIRNGIRRRHDQETTQAPPPAQSAPHTFGTPQNGRSGMSVAYRQPAEHGKLGIGAASHDRFRSYVRRDVIARAGSGARHSRPARCRCLRPCPAPTRPRGAYRTGRRRRSSRARRRFARRGRTSAVLPAAERRSMRPRRRRCAWWRSCFATESAMGPASST